jgi:hypothetical protein
MIVPSVAWARHLLSVWYDMWNSHLRTIPIIATSCNTPCVLSHHSFCFSYPLLLPYGTIHGQSWLFNVFLRATTTLERVLTDGRISVRPFYVCASYLTSLVFLLWEGILGMFLSLGLRGRTEQSNCAEFRSVSKILFHSTASQVLNKSLSSLCLNIAKMSISSSESGFFVSLLLSSV